MVQTDFSLDPCSNGSLVQVRAVNITELYCSIQLTFNLLLVEQRPTALHRMRCDP